MLNRRLIRVRAMQALYAYKTSEKANLQIAKDQILAHFAPDLNSMEFQDKPKLKSDADAGIQLLTAAYALKPAEVSVKADKEVLQAVARAKSSFANKNREDQQAVKRRMINEAELVYDLYLQILGLYIELAQRAANDKKFIGLSRLSDNAIIQALEASNELTNLRLRRNADWSDEAPLVNKLYREVIKENERYLSYTQQVSHTPDEDLSLLKYMLKNILLKHEMLFEYFEKKDIYWTEDIETIRAMVMHSMQPFVDTGEIVIEKLDDEWDESRSFLETLFSEVLENEDELTEMMIPNLKNWEVERVAEIDRILIKLGLVELMNYPNIPVKVTINEIIEIAKNYSSEKSGIFINGVLDALSKNLIANGTIRKSGRGMLDNK